MFFIGCFAGVIVERLWCFIRTGTIEPRVGLIYGPLNPVYGIGALALSKYSDQLLGSVNAVLGALGASLAFLGEELITVSNLGGIRLKYHSIWVCLLTIGGFTLMLLGAWTVAP